MKPHIGIIGTGALGSFYGCKLKQAGNRLTLIARSDYSYLCNNPIDISSIWGDFSCKPDHIVKLGAPASEPLDFLIVTTKVLPIIDFKTILAPYISPQTTLVLLQNGIHIETPFLSYFPKTPLLSALAFCCISRESPGKISHQDYGRLVVGHFPDAPHPKAEELCTLFKAAGVPAKCSNSIGQDRWQKLIWNAPFNPMSVLTGGSTTHDLLRTERSEAFIYETMKEVQLLAKADGYIIPDSVITKNIEDTKKMTPYKTSMLLDIEANRAVETEAILGNAVKFGAKMELDTPNLNALYTLLSLYS